MMVFELLRYHKPDSSPGHRPYHDRLAVGNNEHQSLETPRLDTFNSSTLSCLTGLPLISEP